jgi:hypothetical protein
MSKYSTRNASRIYIVEPSEVQNVAWRMHSRHITERKNKQGIQNTEEIDEDLKFSDNF